MDWKIFFSTFILIFFAELGDKTQLSVLAAAAEARSPAAVFAGAASALIAAVGIAVVVATVFKKFLPVYYLQWISVLVFFGFGMWTLYKIFRPSSSDLAKHASQAWVSGEYQELGLISRWTLSSALEFEEHARKDYEQAARTSRSPEVRDLFLHLANEDHTHHQFVESMAADGSKAEAPGPAASLKNLFEVERLIPKSGTLEASTELDFDLGLLSQAARHEVSAHRFYSALAQSAERHRRLSSFFFRLAAEELQHLQQIEEMRAKLISKRVLLS
jgi:rubrerythrin